MARGKRSLPRLRGPRGATGSQEEGRAWLVVDDVRGGWCDAGAVMEFMNAAGEVVQKKLRYRRDLRSWKKVRYVRYVRYGFVKALRLNLGSSEIARDFDETGDRYAVGPLRYLVAVTGVAESLRKVTLKFGRYHWESRYET